MNKRCLPGFANTLVTFFLALLIVGQFPGSGEAHASDTLQIPSGDIDYRSVTENAYRGAQFDARPPAARTDRSDSRIQHADYPPDSTLDLFLKGIVATDDDQLGYAIIRSHDDQEFSFRAGDSVYGLAELEEIHIDRVIIRHNGVREVLRLPIEFMAREHSGEEARKTEARRIVTDFRQKLLARDGMELIRMFGFEETYRNGGFMGFTVKIAGEDGARMLEVLGVEEGDVITAVNGKRFAESLEAIQSLGTLKDATEVDVEIDRNGVPMFFHFEFDQLEQSAQDGKVATDGRTGNTQSAAGTQTTKP